MTRTITAYFDTRSEAEAAIDRLTDAGVARDTINIVAADETSVTAEVEPVREHKGFLESIGDFFLPDEDRYSYEEGIRRGGSVLTVRAEDAQFESISDILEEAGSVDLDTRESEWRSEGWSGYDATTAGRSGAATDWSTTSDATLTDAALTDTSRAATTSTGYESGRLAEGYTGERTTETRAASADLTGRDDYIPVAEEKLRVGKREVDHGRVRIRSYVVEKPVEASVSLREENVRLDRNTVDRAATAADNLFQDRTIEATSSSEEAVVSKEARVVEEVRLNKDVNVRDETVHDTVRRTEVEVDDDRAGGTVLSDEDRTIQRRGA